MTENHLLAPKEDAELIAAAQAFIAAMTGACQRHYPEFNSWTPDGQLAAAMILAGQQLLRPEAYAADALNLDQAMFALGVAAGNQTGATPDAKVPEFMQRFVNGFGLGRQNRNQAVMSMPTVGGDKPN